jgi:hypothetical protein
LVDKHKRIWVYYIHDIYKRRWQNGYGTAGKQTEKDKALIAFGNGFLEMVDELEGFRTSAIVANTLIILLERIWSNMDRFSQRLWKEHPIKYDPSNYTPWDDVKPRGCDMCSQEMGIYEAPEKCKIVFCRYCKEEAMLAFDLEEEDISYV